MTRKRRSDRSFHDDAEPPFKKFSKFTKVKEKAKQMKLDKQKALAYKEQKALRSQGKGRGDNRHTKFNRKGNGTYSKPGRSGFKKKPGQRVAGGGSKKSSGGRKGK